MHYQLTRLSEILEAKGEIPALQFAAKLKCLGSFRDTIQKGWAARTNPDFYQSIGVDPVEAEQAAIVAVRELVKSAN